MIEVERISKTFGGIVAIDECTLEIPEERITALIGPNGAGKTTLFNIIAGFLRPDSGSIHFDGSDITGLPPHRLFERGLMRTFQIPRVFDRMSVRENLMVVPAEQSGESVASAWLFPGRVRRQEAEIRERANEVLEFLRLSALADEDAGTLSGGQKKLVELGRTMMSDCQTVLLDEPGAGVNRTLLADLVDAIERLNREQGYTFCIVEHDMDLVARLCNPVIVMAQGKVLAEGSFEEIRQNQEVLDAYLGGSIGPREDAVSGPETPA